MWERSETRSRHETHAAHADPVRPPRVGPEAAGRAWAHGLRGLGTPGLRRAIRRLPDLRAEARDLHRGLGVLLLPFAEPRRPIDTRQLGSRAAGFSKSSHL